MLDCPICFTAHSAHYENGTILYCTGCNNCIQLNHYIAFSEFTKVKCPGVLLELQALENDD